MRESTFRRRLERMLWMLLYVIPAAATAWFALRHAVAVPHHEALSFLPPRPEKLMEDWTLLASQFYEHLVLFPVVPVYLIGLLWPGIQPPTISGVTLHLILEPVYAGIISLQLIVLLRRTYTGSRVVRHVLGIGCVALMFSLAAWENWTTTSVVFFFPTIWMLTALLLAMHPTLSDKRIAGLAVCAAISSYSFGNGLATWAVLLPFIWLSTGDPGQRRKRVLLWLTAAAACALPLFWFLQNSPNLSMSQPYGPADVPEFFFRLIGKPFTENGIKTTPILGAAISMAVMFTGFIGWLRRDKNLLAWSAVGLFGLLSAAAITMGRVSLGTDGAAATRYVTVTILTSIGAMGGLATLFPHYKRIGLLPLVLVAASLRAALPSLHIAETERIRLRQGRACLETVELATDRCLGQLHFGWQGPLVRSIIGHLQERTLLKPFVLPEDIQWDASSSGTTLVFQMLETPEPDRYLQIAGEARTDSCLSARHIFITRGTGRLLISHTAAVFPDAYATRWCRPKTGFAADIDTRMLRLTEEETVEAWVWDKQMHTLRRVGHGRYGG